MAQKEKLNIGFKFIFIIIAIVIIFYIQFNLGRMIGYMIEGNIQNEKLVEDIWEEKILNNVSAYVFGPKNYKIYVDDLPRDVDSKYEQVIDDSIDYWENIDNIKFERTNIKEEANVYVSWIKDFGGEYAGLVHTTGYVQIGLGDSECGKWLPYTYDYVLKITKHEFGHIVGYDHSDNPNSIMYHQLNQEYYYIYNEEDVLPSGYYKFFPMCSMNEIVELSIEIESDNPLNIYIIPTHDDFDNLINNKSFNHYESCQESETTSYKKKCNVTNTSGIVISNTYSDTATYKINVKEE